MPVHIASFSQKKKKNKLLFWGSIFLGVVFLIMVTRTGGQKPVVSPVPDDGATPIQKEVLAATAVAHNPKELEETIKNLIGDSWKNYSVYIKDFRSDFEVGINETVIFDAASVNKIPILTVLYRQAQNDRTILERTITTQAKDIQDYGTGIIRYDPVGTTYSVKTLARLMMQKSDNTAAYILANHVAGLKNIQSQIESWGLTQTDMKENNTSNKDIYILMEKLYGGKLVNQALTQEMLAFLKDSDFENRIPRLLPDDATAYHKIGSVVGGIHDAGIIVSPKAIFYVGVFTEGVSDEPEAEELIGKIAKAAYDELAD